MEQAIQEMKARGLRVTLYLFILMDVPPGNSLPNPYPDKADETGQQEQDASDLPDDEGVWTRQRDRAEMRSIRKSLR